MNLKSVLESKNLHGIIFVDTDETMRAAVAKLVDHNIGALLVCEDERPVGIVTERDILRQVAQHGGGFLDRPVSEVMTRDIVVGTYKDDVEWASRVMTDRRFRHMPVVDAGKLVGMISIGDIVRSQSSVAQTEVRFLRDYIAGYYA